MCPDYYFSIKDKKSGRIQIFIFQLKIKNLDASRYQLWTRPDFKLSIANLKIWTCPDTDSGLHDQALQLLHPPSTHPLQTFRALLGMVGC